MCKLLLATALVFALTSCRTSSSTVGSDNESQQTISAAVEKLYMACSTVPQHSSAQQDLIRQMAREAENGKELLLVLRAAVGVFPKDAVAEERSIRSVITGKMLKVATLGQLTEYATRYQVNPDEARALVARMFQLAEQNTDPQSWYRISRAARGVKIEDLALQAQSRGDALTRR